MKRQELAPVLNKSIIDGLKLLDTPEKPDFFYELVVLFESSSLPVVKDLKKFATAQDWKMTGRAAHRLKGSAANIGANRLSALCHVLKEHTDAEAPNAAEMLSLIDHIDHSFNEATQHLRSLTQPYS